MSSANSANSANSTNVSVRPPLKVHVFQAPVQEPVVKSDTIVVVYARVSTPQQADQLPGQVSDVRTVANRVYGHVEETLSVVGSGREWTTLTKKLSGVSRLRRLGKKIKVVLAVKDVSRLTRQKTEHVDNLRRILHDYKITHVYLANVDLEIKIEDLHRNPVFMKGMNAADVEGMAIRDRMRDAGRLKPLCFERRFDCVDVCIDQLRDLAHAIAVCLEENPETDPDYTVQDLIELFRRSGVTLDLEFPRLDDVYGVDSNLPMTELARILNRHHFSVDGELVVKKWTNSTLKKWARHYNRYVEKTKYVPAPVSITVEQMTDAFSKFDVRAPCEVNQDQTSRARQILAALRERAANASGANESAENASGANASGANASDVRENAQWISFYYNGQPNSLPPTWNGPIPPFPGFYYINRI